MPFVFEHRPQVRKQLFPKNIVNLFAMSINLDSLPRTRGNVAEWLANPHSGSFERLLSAVRENSIRVVARWVSSDHCWSRTYIRRADGVYKFFGGEALNHEPRPPLSATPSLEIHRELENRRVAMRYLGEARWFIWWPIFRVDRLRCPSIENFEPCIFIPFLFLFFLFFSLPPSRIIF